MEGLKQVGKNDHSESTKLSYPPAHEGLGVPTLFGEIQLFFPTTEAQKEIWTAMQMNEYASAAYNESVSVHLLGQLNELVFAQAWQKLLARHESLRSTFSGDGQFQIVHKVQLGRLQTHFFTDHPEQKKLLANLQSRETHDLFDLLAGPLVRNHLVKFSEQEYYFLLSAHHMICDGWSMAVLLKELSELYSSLLAGRDMQWSPAAPFSAYASYEFTRRKGAGYLAQELFWLGQHRDSPRQLDLNYDFKRPQVRTHNASRIDRPLAPREILALKKFSGQQKVSLYTTLLAAFEVLLHGLSGEEDLVVGISAADQSILGQENLIGHCVNLLPLRSRPRADKKFSEFLLERKQGLLTAFEHREYTFGTLVQKLALARDPSRLPLVSVLFNVDQQYPGQGLSFTDIQASYRSHPRSFENFELFINITLCGDEGVVECQYNTDLFKGETIERSLFAYEKILAAIVADPRQSLATLCEQFVHSGKTIAIARPPAQKCEKVLRRGSAKTSTELMIAEYWREVIGVHKIQLQDNFFHLGGHSLLATQVLARIKKELCLEIRLPDLFQAPTLGEFSELVEKLLATTRPPLTLTPKKRGAGKPIKLSLMQQRLWYLDQLAPGRVDYNLPSAFSIHGKLDKLILRKSFTLLSQRHAILRTTFKKDAAAFVVQEIADQCAFKINELNFSTCKKEQRAEKLQQTLVDLAQHRFDLEKGPLWTVTLIRLDKYEHVLFFMPHHIIWDGWCFDLFLVEMHELYSALLDKRPATLPLPSLEYADFSAWQADWMKAPELTQQMNYWKNKLAGHLPQLNLPLDKPRPAQMSSVGKTVEFSIADDIVKKLEGLAQQGNATLYMVYLAAYKLLLAKYTGQKDILVGAPYQNRTYTSFENILGFFVNTLVLRTSWSPLQSPAKSNFREFLGLVKETCVAAYNHPDAPIEKLVEALGVARDPARPALYQTQFTYQDAMNRDYQLGPLKLQQINSESKVCHSEIDLWLKKTKDGTVGAFQYCAALFNHSTIVQMKDDFLCLLDSIIARPDDLVDQLDCISLPAKNILADLNKTQRDWGEAQTILQLFSARVQENPEKMAVSSARENLTYAALDRRSEQLAGQLVSQGVVSGNLIGVAFPREASLLVAVLGILKAGAGYLPLDPDFPPERLQYMAEDAQCQWVLTHSEIVERLPQMSVKFICLDRLDLHRFTGIPQQSLQREQIAYVIYTSGSTGRPKGVAITHGSMLNFLLSMAEKPGINTADRLCALTTLSFDISVLELFLPLIAGASVYLVERATAVDGEALMDVFQQQDITLCQATPATWRLLIQAGWQGHKKFKILCGGEAFPKDLQRPLLALAGEVWNMYGPTETTVWSSLFQIKDETSPILIGKPIHNTAVYILDEDLQQVPVGVVGELFIGGAGVAQGYLGRAELTRERFISHPFSPQAGARLYKTGDLARILKSGEIECLGRNDSQVKVRGYRIELTEIEAALLMQEDIQQCVVLPREERPGDMRLMAFIKLVSGGAAGSAAGTQSFNQKLRERLPEYMLPSRYVFLQEFPLTPNEKIDRLALAAMDLKGPDQLHDATRVNNGVVPTPLVGNETEKILAAIWQKILNLTVINTRDNFFDIGGHSLLSVQIFNEIHKQLQVNLPLATLLTAPTIKELAAIIDEKKNLTQDLPQTSVNPWRPLVTLQGKGQKTPLFCMHGVGGNVLNYATLVKSLGWQQPLFGLQSYGLDGSSEPTINIADMASCYIGEMKNIQPQGPYKIAGGSLGGKIALEVARQLKKNGDDVAALIMFDTFGPGININADWQRPEGKLKWALIKIKYRLTNSYNSLRVKIAKFFSRPIPHSLRYWYVEQNNYRALFNYHCRRYAGDLFLIRCPLADNDWYRDPNLGWRDTIEGNIHTSFIEGVHDDLIESEALGEALNAILTKT